MGKDVLPSFPTPAETFADTPRRSNNAPFNDIPPPPAPKYGVANSPYGGHPQYGHYGPQYGQGPPPPQQYHNPMAQPRPNKPPTPQQTLPHHPTPQQMYRGYEPTQYQMSPAPSTPVTQAPPVPQVPQAPAPPPQHRPSTASSVNGPNWTPRVRPGPKGPPPNVGGRPAGYNYDPPPPPRANSPESNLQALFNGVDRNRNGRLSESELSSALVNGDYSKFDRDTVRLMIKMFDRDGDGAIDFEEFGNLWRYLRAWRKIFDKFDLNKNGMISFDEYCRATGRFGYSLSVPCMQYMYDTYTHLDRYGHRTMSFDLFVQSFIHLKRTTDSFKKFDTDRDGYITLGFEQYLLEAISLR